MFPTIFGSAGIPTEDDRDTHFDGAAEVFNERYSMTFQYIMLLANNDATKVAEIMQMPVYDFFYTVSFLIDKSRLKK